MNSVVGLKLVLGGELDKRTARAALRDPVSVIRKTAQTLEESSHSVPTIVARKDEGETIVFDPRRDLTVLLYAHRAVVFDPIAEKLVVDAEGWMEGLEEDEARSILADLLHIAPLVENEVVLLGANNLAPSSEAAAHNRGRLDFIFDVPIPLSDEVHWERFRPMLLSDLSLSEREATSLNDAWFWVAHQFKAAVDSAGAVDPLVHSEFEARLLARGINLLGQLAHAPAEDTMLLRALYEAEVPAMGRLSPADVLSIRQHDRFEEWRRELSAGLRGMLSLQPVDSKAALDELRYRIQRSAADLRRESVRSKSLRSLGGGVKNFVIGSVAGGLTSQLAGADPAPALMATAATAVLGSAAPAVKLIRSWLSGSTRSQRALENHFRLFICHSGERP